jgi:hypothetical protein
MAYASQSGRARTSARQPRAFAVCQRCGMWYNRDQLNFQYEWRGATLQNIYILVCEQCMDVPQEQNRAIILPADPVPIFYPSVEDFEADETDYRAVSQVIPPDPRTGIPVPSTTLRVTENQYNRTLVPFGQPEGHSQAAVMPFNGAIQQAFAKPLALLSVISNGTCTVSVTCAQPHGLQTNSQVSIAGLAYPYANGFYSVVVVTATAFTYMTYAPVPPQSLLTPTSRIITALLGLPLGYVTIPKIYSPGAGGFVVGDIFELENGTGGFLLEDGFTLLGLEV